jgi:neutral trehalase
MKCSLETIEGMQEKLIYKMNEYLKIYNGKYTNNF